MPMTRILFVCHGNICRSPMAEFVMKKLVADAGLSDRFQIDSKATSTEELGNPPYPPARAKMAQMGIPQPPHRASQISRADYGRFDYIIGMDSANMRNMERAFGGDPDGKLYKDFDTTYDQVLEGCQALLDRLRQKV